MPALGSNGRGLRAAKRAIDTTLMQWMCASATPLFNSTRCASKATKLARHRQQWHFFT